MQHRLHRKRWHMEKHLVELMDGSRIEVRVNFGTIYYMQKRKGFYKLSKKVEKNQKLSESESFEMAAVIIYALLRSNGKEVTFDEAMSLMPPGLEEIECVLKSFEEEYKKYNKKKRAKQTPAQ